MPEKKSLPHTRGGVSNPAPSPQLCAESSPHPWGCFHAVSPRLPAVRVFPTPVGVFPYGKSRYFQTSRLPHTRGGVSEYGTRRIPPRASSPHPWGCFLLGAYSVSNFTSLPHTRGGVSGHKRHLWRTERSSPHPWGCFFDMRPIAASIQVFPTPVGVFLPTPCWRSALTCLPHTRGGVSSILSLW